MRRNPYAPKVPCHRVVTADGRLGNYTGGGPERKRKLLEQEGISIVNGRVRHFDEKLFKFPARTLGADLANLQPHLIDDRQRGS